MSWQLYPWCIRETSLCLLVLSGVLELRWQVWFVRVFVLPFCSGCCLNAFVLVRFPGGAVETASSSQLLFLIFFRTPLGTTCPCTASSSKFIMKPLGRVLGGCSIPKAGKVEKHREEELPPWTTAASLQKSEAKHPKRSPLSSLLQKPLLTALAPSSRSGRGARPREATRTLMCGTPSGLEPVPMQAPLVPGFLRS